VDEAFGFFNLLRQLVGRRLDIREPVEPLFVIVHL
jgi:hypothetical protein